MTILQTIRAWLAASTSSSTGYRRSAGARIVGALASRKTGVARACYRLAEDYALTMRRKHGAYVPMDAALALLREHGDVDLMLEYAGSDPWRLLVLIVESISGVRAGRAMSERAPAPAPARERRLVAGCTSRSALPHEEARLRANPPAAPMPAARPAGGS